METVNGSTPTSTTDASDTSSDAGATRDGDVPVSVDQLGDLFVRAIRALGNAGEPDEANTLAARAWWVARDTSPRLADRINGVMHYVAALPSPPQTTTEEQDPPMQELDVRNDPPARRHDVILEAWHELPAGDGFVLVNDHDPKPLYYQFAAEFTDQFSWDYLESGPEVWKVRIVRTNGT